LEIKMPPKVVNSGKTPNNMSTDECNEPFKEGQLVGCNPVGVS